MTSVEYLCHKGRFAASLGYRDAAACGDRIFKRCRRQPELIAVQESKAYTRAVLLPDCVASTAIDAGIAHSAKCHSQNDDCPYHPVQATLGRETADNPRSLLGRPMFPDQATKIVWKKTNDVYPAVDRMASS